ncbi:hypothetical protein HSBAA_34220 [Vreelandella sulfidaeris]|uniref:ribonuclease H n=1 Tax=Vreelandella sulfidaeris TaxID=115553 RepID=A0A455U7M4_9GAMM|nr:hypothetical protein HSBAA_34220 [Halomonas sulfidaeris]
MGLVGVIPGPGGWGVVLASGQHEKTLKGYEAETTNNRMELMAAIMALRTLNTPCEVALWTDSQYVRQGITQWIHNWLKRGWKTAAKQPVKTLNSGKRCTKRPSAIKLNGTGLKGTAGIQETSAPTYWPTKPSMSIKRGGHDAPGNLRY